MKKLLTLTLLSTLFLSACFGGGDSTAGDSVSAGEEAYFITYKSADFEMQVPEGWERITAFTSEYPEELRVLFRNNIIESDFVANVSVMREDNFEAITTNDFAQKKLADHKATLINYRLLSQEDIKLDVGTGTVGTTINTFQGKNDSSTPNLNFMQVYALKGERAWTITATFEPNEDEFTIERMHSMLSSFTLK